jgi:predicted acylesterase/phospholipase RssA
LNTFRIGKFLKKIAESFGLFPGKVFLDFYEGKIAQKLGKHATFKDLQEKIENNNNNNDGDDETTKKFKYLYLVGSNLTTGDSEVFSHIDTPDMIISDAVRISMSIPLIWPPHKYYIRDENNNRVVRSDKQNVDYVDGGLLNNYPIGIFDRKIITKNSEITYFNFKTLGFRLSKPYASVKKQHSSGEEQEELFFPYLTSLINFYFKKEEVNHTKRVEDQQRTVYIDTLGLSPLDFNLSRETMDNLIESGSRAVDEFLSGNNNDENDSD